MRRAPKVDRIAEDRGQQQRPIFGLGPVLQVGKVAAEARPVVHVHQQFGDLDARQQLAGLVDQCLRLIRHRRIQRGDLGVGGATEQKVHLSSVAAPQTLATSG